jgi:hypothetical protein
MVPTYLPSLQNIQKGIAGGLSLDRNLRRVRTRGDRYWNIMFLQMMNEFMYAWQECNGHLACSHSVPDRYPSRVEYPERMREENSRNLSAFYLDNGVDPLITTYVCPYSLPCHLFPVPAQNFIYRKPFCLDKRTRSTYLLRSSKSSPIRSADLRCVSENNWEKHLSVTNQPCRKEI